MWPYDWKTHYISGGGGKNLDSEYREGAGVSLWTHLNPPNASNTNPVRNFYLWRSNSSETASSFSVTRYQKLEKVGYD